MILLGEYDQAFQAAERAQEIFDRLDDPWRLARLEINVGNIYHRRYEETFVSRVFTWKESCRAGRLAVDAATLCGSHIGLYVRSAGDKAGLASAPWRKVAGDSLEVSADDRALQYRLDLFSANGDAYPVVRKVDLSLK